MSLQRMVGHAPATMTVAVHSGLFRRRLQRPGRSDGRHRKGGRGGSCGRRARGHRPARRL